MPTLPQPRKIVRFLEERQGSSFTAREIAEFLVRQYAAEYARKHANPRFPDDRAFLSQIIAEIGAQKDALKRMCPSLIWRDRPKPRRYCVPLAEGGTSSLSSAGEPAQEERDADEPDEAVLRCRGAAVA